MMLDEDYMRLAIMEAEKGIGKTFPNPVVGAVIVAGGKIIAKGYHEQSGGPHAEIAALKMYDRDHHFRAEMYVTLEPCSTKGRTGACCEAIIQAGIQRVVFGSIDPNPQHNGRAVQILKDAGIDVASGILKAECDQLNPEYFRHVKENLKNKGSR